jgi:DNA-directed RNA polymerase subunit RPC12/RpoP
MLEGANRDEGLMIRYTCASCGALLESADQMGGQQDECPICGTSSVVPPSQKRKNWLKAVELLTVFILGGLCLFLWQFAVRVPSGDAPVAHLPLKGNTIGERDVGKDNVHAQPSVAANQTKDAIDQANSMNVNGSRVPELPQPNSDAHDRNAANDMKLLFVGIYEMSFPTNGGRAERTA